VGRFSRMRVTGRNVARAQHGGPAGAWRRPVNAGKVDRWARRKRAWGRQCISESDGTARSTSGRTNTTSSDKTRAELGISQTGAARKNWMHMSATEKRSWIWPLGSGERRDHGELPESWRVGPGRHGCENRATAGVSRSRAV